MGKLFQLKIVNEITFWGNYRFFTFKVRTLKFLITIFFTIFLVNFSNATDLTDGKGNSKTETEPKTKAEKKKEGAESIRADGTDPTTEKPTKKRALYSPDTSTLEEASDSTYNSVNKYNFIFYFIYKYKYDAEAASLRSFLD